MTGGHHDRRAPQLPGPESFFGVDRRRRVYFKGSESLRGRAWCRLAWPGHVRDWGPGSGRLRRRKAFKSHLLEHKSAERKRRLGRESDFAPGDEKQIKRMLGM